MNKNLFFLVAVVTLLAVVNASSAASSDNVKKALPAIYYLLLDDRVKAEVTGELNDTGSDIAGNDPSGFQADCTSDFIQDCYQGRDATHDDDSDGHAGFSFTKVDHNGYPLPLSAPSWNCVKDNVTGLMWEVKTDGESLHDATDTYNWFNSDNATNGGGAGYEHYQDTTYPVRVAKCYGYDVDDSTRYCNTEAFIRRVNDAGWCGYNDWRVPEREELRSIADYSSAAHAGALPAIDLNFFPYTQHLPSKYGLYWSYTPSANNPTKHAWNFSFNDGWSFGVYADKVFARHVRLVRGD